MSIRFRDGRRGDGAMVAALFERSFTDTFGHLYAAADLGAFLAGMGAERFEAELDDPRFAFRLAFDGDELAGYVKLGPPELPLDTPPETVELSQLYVLEAWHGAGIASALMDWVLERAHVRGTRHIQLSVFVDNHRARRFYERFGFDQVGEYDFMVGSHADRDLVLRHLVLESRR